MKRINLVLCALVTMAGVGRLAAAPVELRMGQVIAESCTVKPGVYALAAGEDAALRIQGDGITVDFQGAQLNGAQPGQQPDAYTGKGLVITGKNITIKNLKVQGYKVGIYAHDCPGLTIEDVDISGNYQKHLLSTPDAEDGSDWIFPHNNSDDEWMNNYGAGLYLRRADGATIRRIFARNGQNGIILDQVTNSKLYDCDCSFLSGWGLAMWKSSKNVITRNAFDFCVRGYSHGVYNRGQDSAGILMFEQNNENVIAENSATHGGDGFFGFGGNESLAQAKRTGNNGNLLIRNDFSYAPAHGIEMTFSFDNRFIENRIVDNAICGVWGGYSQDTLIAGNLFEGNGELGYGLERGGVNIEHGCRNIIVDNTFKDNKCGVHLWWDDDKALLQKPWTKANYTWTSDNVVARNLFENNRIALHSREARNTLFAANRFPGLDEKQIEKLIVTTPGGKPIIKDAYEDKWEMPEYPVFGDTRPVGARKHLAGRDKIIVTDWGPFNYEHTALFPAQISGGDAAKLYVLGPAGTFRVKQVTGTVKVEPREGSMPGTVTVTAPGPGLFPFAVEVEAGGQTFTTQGVLLSTQWAVQFFHWEAADDPREHPDKWRELIAGKPLETQTVSAIDFRWGGGPPSKKVPGDRFGTVATTQLELPFGRYKIATVSDDGIRVWVDDTLVIDDWTWHGAKPNDAVVNLKSGKRTIRVEHFEINGAAQLQVNIEPLPSE